MNKIVFAALVASLLSLSAFADEKAGAWPYPIRRAHQMAHRAADHSEVRNLFMFNYTYYAKGFCKDQDCSDAKVQAEIAGAKSKMGDDFLKFQPSINQYASAISYLQRKLHRGDLATLSGERTYLQDLKSGVFVTCVDFAKAVMGLAIELGFPADQLFIYVTMAEEGYRKMCPAADGSLPVLPRPLVHTLVAYQSGGHWYALNVEDPDAIPLPLGARLPKRLEVGHQFTYPALVAYQKLLYAGAFPAEKFMNGYPFKWLMSITAAGKLELDSSLVRCE